MSDKIIVYIGGYTSEELARVYDFTNKIFRKQVGGFRVVQDYEPEENYKNTYRYVVAIECEDERKVFELSLLFPPVDKNELVFYKPYS